jgi:hypothetical protein
MRTSILASAAFATLGFTAFACTKSSGSAQATTDGGGGGDDSGQVTDDGPGVGPSLDSDIAAIVSGVSADNISKNIQTLVAFGTRSTCSDATGGSQGIGGARDWIKSQFDAIGGMTTQLFAFTPGVCTQPATRHDVVAVLPGKGHPDRLVIVGGHYDSRTVDVTDGTSPAPGANDSGSQTALVLELARVFAGHSFDATLVFVAFAGEEQGLFGSKALAASPTSLVPGGHVVAMLNCDIVGGDNTVEDATTLKQFRMYSPGTPREVSASTPDGTPDDTSPSRGLMRYVATWGAAYVPAMTIIPKLREDRPGRGGDHESFIAASLPGVRFIEPIENLAHEHTGQDLFQYVTPPYTANVAQVVASVAASLARATDAPGGIGASGNASAPSVTWTAPASGIVDHYVVAARPVTENFYHSRVRAGASATSAQVAPADLGVDPASPYFLSVAAVDAAGHESLFAYPEYRCDASGCVVPAGALNVTATK